MDEAWHYRWQVARGTVWARPGGDVVKEPEVGFPKGEAFEWSEDPGPDGAWKLVTVENGNAWWQRLLRAGADEVEPVAVKS